MTRLQIEDEIERRLCFAIESEGFVWLEPHEAAQVLDALSGKLDATHAAASRRGGGPVLEFVSVVVGAGALGAAIGYAVSALLGWVLS